MSFPLTLSRSSNRLPLTRSRSKFVPESIATLEDRKLLTTVSASAGAYYVEVYTQSFSNGDIDLRANLYRNGNSVNLGIPVATTNRREINPAVTINDSGTFSVAYEDVLSSTDHDIKMRVYSSLGSNLYNNTVDTSSKIETSPSISMNSFGRIVVSYTQNFSSTDLDVKASEYYPSGASYFKTPFTVANSNHNEFDSSVRVSPEGNWAVSYTYRYSSTDLDAKVFVHKTSGSSTTYTVANSSSSEDATRVTSFSGSQLVVQYRKNGLYYSKTLSV